MNVMTGATKVRPPGKVRYALTDGHAFAAMEVNSPAWQMVKKLYDRGDCHPLVVTAIEREVPVYVSYARDADSLFTVCHIVCNNVLYTGVAKRTSYARNGDKPGSAGTEISFYRALCSMGVPLPVVQGVLAHAQVNQQ